MEAILKLYRSGMNRAQVAAALNTSTQLVGMYERHKRFPSPEKYQQLIDLGVSRGVTLLASDFAKPTANAA